MKDFDEANKILIKRFGQDALISLATIDGGRPAVRIVNSYYEKTAHFLPLHTRNQIR